MASMRNLLHPQMAGGGGGRARAASSLVLLLLLLHGVPATTTTTTTTTSTRTSLSLGREELVVMMEKRASKTTRWNIEMMAASDIVRQRQRRERQRRGRERRLRLQRRRRDLQSGANGGRYNDYLPDDDDGDDDVDDDDGGNTNTNRCLSPLQKWFVTLIESIGLKTWDDIVAYNVTSLAYLYKHHVSGDVGGIFSDEYFGTYGERTDEMRFNHENLRLFWSEASSKRSDYDDDYYEDDYYERLTTTSGSSGSGSSGGRGEEGTTMSDVVLLGMHGVDLADETKLIPTLQQMYGLDGSDARELGDKIVTLVQSLPGAFNNPILTANAIAIQSLDPDGSNRERDSIILGDGVFAFLEWLKLNDDGPDYIHSHEFGHHMQYDLGVDKGGNGREGWTTGEETRRWEMMADVFGTYYLAHAEGGKMDAGRLLDVRRAAYSLGDCEDASAVGSHHGTPRQRECASGYGANLALPSYLDGGHRMPPRQLRRMFDEKYARILDLDGELCDGVLDSSLREEEEDGVYGGEVVGGSSAGGGGGGDDSGNGVIDFPHGNLETPSWTVPVASPAGSSQASGYQPFNSAPGSGWSYGTPFEAYNPEDNSGSENELDKPPPIVQNNGTGDGEEEGWFGESEFQWVNGRTAWSGGNRSCIGRTFIAVVALAKILFLLS